MRDRQRFLVQNSRHAGPILGASTISSKRSGKLKEGWQSVKKTATDKETYAGFARRTAASVIDWFWLNAVILLFLMPPIVLVSLYFMCGWLPEFLGPDPGPALVWIAGLFGVVGPIVLNWLYYACFESSRFAATPGKILMGLKVTDVNGKPFSFWSCSQKQAMTTLLFSVPLFLNGAVSFLCSRYNLKGFEIYLYVTASLIFIIPAVGYGLAIFDKRRQTFYDKMVARIVSEDLPEDDEEGSPRFFKSLLGKVILAITPVLIVGLSASVGTMLHRPDVNPLLREAMDTPKKWQQLGIARVQRKVIVEHTVKAGDVIKPADVSEVRVPSTDIGPDQVVCTDFVVGKKPMLTLKPGDFMSLRDLPYKAAQQTRKEIFAEAARTGAVGLCPHAKNRSTAQLQEFRALVNVNKEQILSESEFEEQKLPSTAPGVKVFLPLEVLRGNTSRVNYRWEFIGKKCRNHCKAGGLLERRNIAQSGQVFVTTRAIVNGEKITAADLQSQNIDPIDCAYSTVSEQSLIEGKRASKGLPKGKIILANDLLWN